MCLSDTSWDSPVSGRQRITRRLAWSNDVIYVDPPDHVDVAWRNPLQARWRHRLVPDGPRLSILEMPHYAGKSYREGLQTRLLDMQARIIRNVVGKRPFMILAFHPLAFPLVERFPDTFVAFHVYDHYGALETTNRAAIDALDEQLTKRANVVIAVSEKLASAREVRKGQTFVVHNGVDYDIFAASYPEPADLASIPHPRVGYVARLNPLVDFELLRDLASGGRQNVVVIGPLRGLTGDAEQRAHAILTQTPGLYWLGERHHEQVPAYVAHRDACAIAYRVTEATEVAATPQKLFEYLAAGKPVVTSNLPLMHQFGRLVSVARTKEEWSQAIRTALDTDSDELRQARRQLAADNSWDAQVSRIRRILEQAS